MTAAGTPTARPALEPPARPSRLGELTGRLSRHLRRWLGRARSAIGLRRGVKVQGVYYKELAAESLQRALSRKGRGWKEYRVTFPDGSKQIIRASPQRVFDDIMGPLGYDAGHGVLAPLLEIIRPGSRLLLMNAGTGSAAAWLGAAVGRSGAVVALESDEQSVSFAAKRYPRQNVSIELGAADGLRGETDGSFHGAAVLRPATEDPGQIALAEVWRVVAPGGWMLLMCPTGRGDSIAAMARELPGVDGAGVRSDAATGSSPDLVFVTRRAEESQKGARPSGDGPGEGSGGLELQP